jgi:hypothetical protein
MASLCVPTDEQRCAALDLVLGSTLFARSGQLRLLQYVCEMEMAGKASELSEHLIGVEAPGYSTGEDYPFTYAGPAPKRFVAKSALDTIMLEESLQIRGADEP